MRYVLSAGLVFLLSMVALQTAWADLRVEREEKRESGRKGTFIPYAFAAESQGTALGLSYLATDVVKPGTSWIVAGHVTDKDGQFFSTFFHNYQLNSAPRLTFSGGGYVFNNPALRGYFSLDPQSDAGSNDSSKEDYIETTGDNNYFDFRMNYLLPWADGDQHIDRTIKLKHGIVKDHGVPVTSYNPFISGRSYLETRLTRDYQNYEGDADNLSFATNLLRLEYRHNNSDLPRNPTHGNQIRLGLNRDAGWLDSTQAYTFLDFSYSQYFDLGATEYQSQQVIALNFWTADTPSWDKGDKNGQVFVDGRPPPYKGATLGGLYRLKAYDSNRFHDRSAIYYGAEYRSTFHYNPSKLIGLLKPFGIDWFQAVLYMEAGRVNSRYDLATLHSDMKADVGLGVRAMASTQVFRLDIAYGEEGAQMWVMVGHPF